MNNPNPTVILVHCMEGVDRTGEVIGSYQMKYHNLNSCDIVHQDTFINDNCIAPKRLNYNALMWYESYLKSQKG